MIVTSAGSARSALIGSRKFDDRNGVPVTVEVDQPVYDDANGCWRCVWRIGGLGRGIEPFDGFGLGEDSMEALMYALWGVEAVLSAPRNDPPVTRHGTTDLGLPRNSTPPLSDEYRNLFEGMLPPHE
ncbi:hypothetical protein O3I_034560 [Nocardia brasiliensis ATCC 700358]|uniref:DUF6968 domain-containing protein n=1 Tax=Nocardia brasiliensis (strain ATCC 700358 / HUJEG-1) TaxID=1133849 RepID=K0FBM8_NOCB7|nr:hypothetical protein O3I_034560 [Nocardia brasiliensis ATCC 700358]